MIEPKATTTHNELIEPPPGWVRVDGLGGPVNVFEVDSSRLDFPEKWRSRSEKRERERLARDPRVQAEIKRLLTEFDQFGPADFAKIPELAMRGWEISESRGNTDVSDDVSFLLEHLREEIRKATEHSIPEDVSYLTALRYISEKTLPVGIIFYVYDELPSPVKLVVNMQSDKMLMSIMPGEAVIRFRGIVRRDINRIGRFITEAIALQSPERQTHATTGRKAIDESPDDMATAELVARLFHWEGWSQRRIAAFLGWMKPTDDWSNPKTRARIEQRVRRWLRIGEARLAITSGDDEIDGLGVDTQPWKQRPPHLEVAVQAEERKKGRR